MLGVLHGDFEGAEARAHELEQVVAQEPSFDEHVPPTGILPQLIETQVLPVVQSADVVVQVVLHAVVAHWYGAHELVVAGRHVPAPSHDRGVGGRGGDRQEESDSCDDTHEGCVQQGPCLSGGRERLC